MSHIYLDAFRISNYKSFTDAQEFSDLSKINIIVGKNNSGKSNVLLWLSEKYATMCRTFQSTTQRNLPQFNYQDLDYPQKDKTKQFYQYVGVKKSNVNYLKLLEGIINSTNESVNIDRLGKILACPILNDSNGILWFEYHIENNKVNISEKLINSIYEECLLGDNIWEMMSRNFKDSVISGNSWASRIVKNISPAFLTIPNITFIPAIREIKDKVKNTSQHAEMQPRNDFDGNGIIKELARLQNPGHSGYDSSKERFERINKFLQSVTGNKTASIEIPSTQDQIIVKMDGKILPLSALGTGIHEVIILAAASTLRQKQILCLEEPEIHLHPTLQKKLIKYLYENTSNQYFISTHSVHLLNSKLASIYHIQLEDGYSKVEHVESPSKQSDVCIDLGYRASDIIQSNCIIWVEGPSDRIYLNHWIKSIDKDLVEGIHYSIMFYGGRLLSHLTANDPEVEEFISLRRMNRNVAIVIDSDRKEKGGRINATKSRIRKEIESDGGLVWITSGKEIENYIKHDLMEKTIKKVHPSAVKVMSEDKYLSHLRYKTKAKVKDPKIADKVKVARKIAEGTASLEVDDLKKRVNELVSFIKKANDLE